MSLLVYNLTAAPLALNNGLLGIAKTVIPASTAGAGVRGEPWYASGDELEGLDATAYAALQTQQLSALFAFEWTDAPEYPTGTLYVAAAQLDVADMSVNLYADPAGSNSNPGTLAAPLQTFEALMNAKPVAYQRGLRFNLNVDPTTAALNTTKKVYTLSAQALQFLFPEVEGENGESVFIQGGFTNELGDLTATAGSTSSLTTNQNFLVDQYKGALLSIISGTGANQRRIIRGNTAGPNSVITPEITFAVAPDATSVYRISYPNVQIQFSQRLLFAGPPQTLLMRGIEFVFTGVGTTQTLQVGNDIAIGGGGVVQFTGCQFNLGAGANRANFRCRGTARLQLDGLNTNWVGPNNPLVADDQNTGNYIFGAQSVGCNVGGEILGGASLVKDCLAVSSISGGNVNFVGGTFENSPISVGGADSVFNFTGLSALRGRVRLLTGIAASASALGSFSSLNGPTFNNVEFSDITGDLVIVATQARAALGNITVLASHAGTGDSFAVTGTTVTLTDAAATFVASDAGRPIVIAGATTPANNGTFTITKFIDPSNITYTNAAGVAEVYAGAWTIGTNTGVGLKVLTGADAAVAATTLLSGTGGAIQVDTGPVLTLAQALAQPFNGNLRSNVVQPYPIADPGTGVAIPVTASGAIGLIIGAGVETNTLAIPTYVGQKLIITANTVAGGSRAITAASAINQAGNTIMTFTPIGDSIVLEGALIGGLRAWRVTSNDGVALS